MADETKTEPQLIITEEGAFTPEEIALREAAGTAPTEIPESELLRAESERAKGEVFDEPLTTFGEAALSAATFGLSDVVAPGSAEERLERAARAEVSPRAALAGTVAGIIVPTVLSGGTLAPAGLGRAAAVAARLTPAGRMAAMSGRIASRGGLARKVAAGALEGAAQAGGDYLSRVTLNDNAEFSGEALAESVLHGAALGGAVGGAADVVAGGLGRLGRRLDTPSPIATLGEEAADAVVPGFKRMAPALGKKAAQKTSAYKKIVRKKLKSDSADELRNIGSKIDDIASRSPRNEILKITSEASFETVDDATRALANEAGTLAERLEVASKETRDAWRAYSKEVGLENAKRRITREALPETDDLLVGSIAEMDDLAIRYDRVADELSARMGIPREAINKVDSAGRALGKSLAEEAEKVGLAKRVGGGVRKVGDVASSALGAVELARMTGMEVPGVPSPRDIPGVGELLGYYFKYKGLKAAAKGVGILPATKATRAAEKTVSAMDRMKARVKAFASKGLKGISRSQATRTIPAALTAKLARIESTDSAQVAADTYTDLADVSELAAQAAAKAAARAVDYLKGTAPKDPLPGRLPGMSPWQPSAQESMDYIRRESAVLNPDGALDRIMTSPSNRLEIEALEAVYPERLALFRNELMESAEELKKNLPFSHLKSLATDLGLPLTVANIPGYGTKTPAPPMVEPQPMFSQPSTPGASPSVNLEKVEPRRPR